MAVTLGDGSISSDGDLKIQNRGAAGTSHIHYDFYGVNIGNSDIDNFGFPAIYFNANSDVGAFVTSQWRKADSAGDDNATWGEIVDSGVENYSSTNYTSTVTNSDVTAVTYSYTPYATDGKILVDGQISQGIQKTGTDNDAQGSVWMDFVQANGTIIWGRIGAYSASATTYESGRLVDLNTPWTAAASGNRTTVLYTTRPVWGVYNTQDVIADDGNVYVAVKHKVYNDTTAGYSATSSIYAHQVRIREFK